MLKLYYSVRQNLLLIAGVLIIIAGGLCYKSLEANNTTTGHIKLQNMKDNQLNVFLNQTGESLIAQHENSNGGWRFKSGIQAPHYQTDRDVGAAGVGMGFLALADAEPQDSRWPVAAKHTADWLIAVSKQDGKGGRYWPDYVDDAETSDAIYTSFDDGAIGIGDFFWQLYEKTGDSKYKQVAIESVQWTLSNAEPYGGGYRWKWNLADTASPYYLGMGEGSAGIIYALATFSQRLQPIDPSLAAKCKAFAEGGLRYIKSVKQVLAQNNVDVRAIPETGTIGQGGDTTLNSGYLSGAAGHAFMYLNMYRIFGNKEYLNEAISILSWLNDTQNGPMVKVDKNSITWKLALDPQSTNDNRYATGVEEGNAGIGWTFLQAYKITGNKNYLQTAEAAANWLLETAVKNPGGGLSWHEDESPANSLIHANLNNGAAGIGMFLQDVYLVNGNKTYQAAADGTFKWLMLSANHDGNGVYWQDNGGEDSYSNDPSWHWGLAGIIEFVQRLNGGAQNILGEQPGIDSRN